MGLAKTERLLRPRRVGGFPLLVNLRPAPPLPTLATGLEEKGSGISKAGTLVVKKGWFIGSGKRVAAVRVRNGIDLVLASSTERVLDGPVSWCL